MTPERDPADHEDWFGIYPPAGAEERGHGCVRAGVPGGFGSRTRAQAMRVKS